MRLLVCGGREYCNDRVLDFILSKYYIDTLIHGAARGADSLAAEWAKAHRIHTLPFPAKWKQYGKSAGHLRNTQMIIEGCPDMVIAFPGGTGTANMIKQAESHNIKVIPL